MSKWIKLGLGLGALGAAGTLGYGTTNWADKHATQMARPALIKPTLNNEQFLNEISDNSNIYLAQAKKDHLEK